jgi:hypothetical protein
MGAAAEDYINAEFMSIFILLTPGRISKVVEESCSSAHCEFPHTAQKNGGKVRNIKTTKTT